VSQQGNSRLSFGLFLNNSYDGCNGSYYNQNLPCFYEALYVHMPITSLQGAKLPRSARRTYQALSLLAHIYYFIIVSTKIERYNQLPKLDKHTLSDYNE